MIEAASNSALHDWLDRLAREELLTITRPNLPLKFGIAAVAKRLDGQKAVLFPAPGGHSIPILCGILSRREWFSDAFGVRPDQLIERVRKAVSAPIPCREVDDAPAYEFVHNKFDLTSDLPVPTFNELDSAPYLSAAMLVMRNPVTGAQNASINRCQLNGPNRLGVLIATRDTRLFYETAEAANVALEIALVIGPDPMALLASQVSAPAGQDELEIAGAMRGQPLKVVKCRTNSVRVPADAEIVLEGRILPKVREAEGPFGEFQQVYADQGLREVIEVDLLAHRRNPIFQAIVSGSREHALLGSIPKEASLLNSLQQSFPNVLDVHLTIGGSGRFHANIRLRKRAEGEAKNIIMAAFGANVSLKKVTVVDDDIDIYSQEEVEWATATRFRADRDLVIVNNALCAPLEPTSENSMSAKLGLDATKPLRTKELRYTRTFVPGENEVVLENILVPNIGTNWRETLNVK